MPRSSQARLAEPLVPAESLPLDLAAAEAFVAAGETCTRGWLAWQQEMMRFAFARWQADAELSLSLARCRDIGEAVGLQQDWLATAARDYAAEAGQLLQMAGRFAGEGMACWREATPEAARDMVESAQVIE